MYLCARKQVSFLFYVVRFGIFFLIDMTKKLLLSGLALATLALNACSSEPSDWRPDKKVSTDLVAPGTRSDTYFMNEGEQQGGSKPETQANGAAIPRPINSGVTLDERAMPNPKKTVSANDQEIRHEQGEAAQEKAKARSRSVQDDDSHQ